MGNLNSSSSSNDPSTLISETVKAHQVVIFSKTTCTFCDAAKDLVAREARLIRRNHPRCAVSDVAVVELDAPDMQPVQSALAKRTGVFTVPQVFINEEFIGGASDTANAARNGALKLAMMAAAKCLPNQNDRKDEDAE